MSEEKRCTMWEQALVPSIPPGNRSLATSVSGAIDIAGSRGNSTSEGVGPSVCLAGVAYIQSNAGANMVMGLD